MAAVLTGFSQLCGGDEQATTAPILRHPSHRDHRLTQNDALSRAVARHGSLLQARDSLRLAGLDLDDTGIGQPEFPSSPNTQGRAAAQANTDIPAGSEDGASRLGGTRGQSNADANADGGPAAGTEGNLKPASEELGEVSNKLGKDKGGARVGVGELEWATLGLDTGKESLADGAPKGQRNSLNHANAETSNTKQNTADRTDKDCQCEPGSLGPRLGKEQPVSGPGSGRGQWAPQPGPLEVAGSERFDADLIAGHPALQVSGSVSLNGSGLTELAGLNLNASGFTARSPSRPPSPLTPDLNRQACVCHGT